MAIQSSPIKRSLETKQSFGRIMGRVPTMDFDKENKVIIDTLEPNEAKAFIKFLKSEIARHQMDIDNARDLIYEVALKFKLGDLLE